MVEVRGEHSDPELAVEVWQGPLCSRASCSGPAGTTAITSLQLRPREGKEKEKEKEAS